MRTLDDKPQMTRPAFKNEAAFMTRALQLAQNAAQAGEVPVGALITCGATRVASVGKQSQQTSLSVADRLSAQADIPHAVSLTADKLTAGVPTADKPTAGEQIIAEAENRVQRDQDGTAHAELLVLRQAALVLGRHLEAATLWVTLEPCAMCAEAASHARLGRLVFAARDPRWGAVEHGARLYDQPWSRWRPEVIAGVREAESAALLRGFFADKRTTTPAS